MEIQRYWRLIPINNSFTGKRDESLETEVKYFRYPGGGILLEGTCEEVYERFVNKGFKEEVIEEILFDLFGGITSESPIPFKKIVES